MNISVSLNKFLDRLIQDGVVGREYPLELRREVWVRPTVVTYQTISLSRGPMKIGRGVSDGYSLGGGSIELRALNGETYSWYVFPTEAPEVLEVVPTPKGFDIIVGGVREFPRS